MGGGLDSAAQFFSRRTTVKFLIAVVLSLIGIAAHAQTVGPFVFEGGKGRARGEFSIRNDNVTPLVATVEAVSFRLTPEGKSVFLPLDPKATVKLYETAAKIGARQQHTFAFEVDCQSDQPCLVALLPRMVQGVRVQDGLQLGLIIPVSIYLCPDKAKACRARARTAAGIK